MGFAGKSKFMGTASHPVDAIYLFAASEMMFSYLRAKVA